MYGSELSFDSEKLRFCKILLSRSVQKFSHQGLLPRRQKSDGYNAYETLKFLISRVDLLTNFRTNNKSTKIDDL